MFGKIDLDKFVPPWGGPLPDAKFERSPSNTGGPNCVIRFEGSTAYVSGSIAWYPEDLSIGRGAGNRVGLAIYPPTGLSAEVIEEQGWRQQDHQKRRLFKNDKGLSGDVTKLYWYPLITDPNESRIIWVNWDGDGPMAEECYTVKFLNVTLEPEPDPDPDPDPEEPEA